MTERHQPELPGQPFGWVPAAAVRDEKHRVLQLGNVKAALRMSCDNNAARLPLASIGTEDRLTDAERSPGCMIAFTSFNTAW